MLGKQDGGLESNVKKIEEGGRATKQQLNSTKLKRTKTKKNILKIMMNLRWT